jgi:hypothetical protein
MIKVFPDNPTVKMPDGTMGYPETVLLRLIDTKGAPNVKIAATEDGSAINLGGVKPHARPSSRPGHEHFSEAGQRRRARAVDQAGVIGSVGDASALSNETICPTRRMWQTAAFYRNKRAVRVRGLMRSYRNQPSHPLQLTRPAPLVGAAVYLSEAAQAAGRNHWLARVDPTEARKATVRRFGRIDRSKFNSTDFGVGGPKCADWALALPTAHLESVTGPALRRLDHLIVVSVDRRPSVGRSPWGKCPGFPVLPRRLGGTLPIPMAIADDQEAVVLEAAQDEHQGVSSFEPEWFTITGLAVPARHDLGQ